METNYIIYDIINNEYFCGCDDSTGKPVFCYANEYKPLFFDSETKAINRLSEEIELFGDSFLENRVIEIKKVYLF